MTSPACQKRVVVTGYGVVSALGQDMPTFLQNLRTGKSGVGRITAFDATDYPTQIAAEVHGFDPSVAMDPKEARRNDRYTHFAVYAAKAALRNAQLDTTRSDPDRIGVIIGSGIGGIATLEAQARQMIERGPRKVSPFLIPSLIANIAGGIVAIEIGARGPNYAVVSACATASHAIGEALKILRAGTADVVIAGGSEAPITPLGFAGFCSMKAMSTRNDAPEKASRPFDRGRDGFVMGEGAGILVLETLDHALARGARVCAELAGYGASADAFHITQPDPDGRGLALAMSMAMQDAGLRAEDIGYINAHGTSTPYNDKFETLAIKKVFGEHARNLAVSSTKSMTGHLLGAAGGVEAAITCDALHSGILPPTINLDEPDLPDCDLDYVPHVARERRVTAALSNNLGFGGQNACLAFKAYTA